MYLKERSIMINIERLKDARSDEELRQEDIAKKLNISKSGYTRYENELDDFPIILKIISIIKKIIITKN